MSSHTLSRRRFLVAGSAAVLGAAATGCGAGNIALMSTGRTTTFRYQGWTGQVLFPELAKDLGYLPDVELQWIGNSISGPQDIQAAVTGDTHFGGAFNGSILRLAAAGAPITALIGYYGTDATTFGGYFVPEKSPIKTAKDLLGATVAVNTLGGHYDDVLRMYLQRKGFSPAQVASPNLVVVPPASTEQALRSGQLDVGVLNGIFREKAVARGGLRAVFTDYDLLGTFTAGSYVMRNDVIASNPTAVQHFIAGTARAVAWTQRTPRGTVVQRMRDIITRRKRNEDTSFVDYWKSSGVARTGGVIQRKELTTWLARLQADHQLDRRHLNLDAVYRNDFNPYATAADRAHA